MLNVICWSFTPMVSSFCTSMGVLLVAKNDRLNMIGTSLSSSQSNIIKFTGKTNLSTFTKTSSIFLTGWVIDLSTYCKVIVVGLPSPIPNCLITENGIKLMLVLRSHNVLPTFCPSIEHGVVKLHGSLSFGGISFFTNTLQHFVSTIVSYSLSFIF